MSTNVMLVCGYSGFLLAVAYGFDVMARRVAVRAQRWRTGAFRYHPDHDAWVCPQDQWLWPTAYDPQQRVVRYRAKPAVCNACPVKHSCTTSPDTGVPARSAAITAAAPRKNVNGETAIRP